MQAPRQRSSPQATPPASAAVVKITSTGVVPQLLHVFQTGGVLNCAYLDDRDPGNGAFRGVIVTH